MSLILGVNGESGSDPAPSLLQDDTLYKVDTDQIRYFVKERVEKILKDILSWADTTIFTMNFKYLFKQKSSFKYGFEFLLLQLLIYIWKIKDVLKLLL